MNYQNHNHIKNYDCLRTVTLWAGILGIIQSLLWIGLTLTGIFAYTCYIDLPGNMNYGSLVRYVFYELYFKGSCEPTGYQQIGIELLGQNPTILDPEDILIWTCVYLGVAVCWLLSSVLLLTHLKKNCVPTTLGVVFAWVTLTFFICALDLAQGIIFGIDYGYFNQQAYDFNFSTGQQGVVNSQNAVWIGAQISAASLMIVSFKGFILWIVNFGLLVCLLVKGVRIVSDKDRNDTLFKIRKDSDDILTTRPPIDAYEHNSKPMVYTNEAFVPDTRSIGTIELNQEAIVRAARMSTDPNLHDRRFRNLDNFQQYPPPRANNNRPDTLKPQETVIAATVVATAPFPAPDYSPPMTRANQPPQNGNLRNQRYQ